MEVKEHHPDELEQTQDLLKSIQIQDGWRFRQVGNKTAGLSGWLPVARFPTNVHLDLAHHGMIPNPIIGKNEEQVQWVGEQSWAYKTTFKSPSLSQDQKAVIAFDGLDTHATVSLNGKEVLKTKDMFIPERLDVTNHLKFLAENELEIVFESSYLIGKRLVESDPGHKYGCWNGRPYFSRNSLSAYSVIASESSRRIAMFHLE